jgi:hypothetical protein
MKQLSFPPFLHPRHYHFGYQVTGGRGVPRSKSNQRDLRCFQALFPQRDRNERASNQRRHRGIPWQKRSQFGPRGERLREGEGIGFVANLQANLGLRAGPIDFLTDAE